MSRGFGVEPLVVEDAHLPGRLEAPLRALLDAAFGSDPEEVFSDDDWEHARGGTWVLVLDGGRHGTPLACGAVVPRRLEAGGRPRRTGYLEAVAVRPDVQGRRLGAAVVRRATQLVREHYALGALGTGSHGFYERLGWERWRGPLLVRTAAGPVRTPEEEGYVMVLRHGPTADLDLSLDLSCEERPGDDW